MKTSQVQGKEVMNGTFATLWLDGEEIFEVESCNASITFNRETLTFAGNLDEDSKVVGQAGEGSFVVKKVFSRGLAKMVQMTKDGKDVRSQLISKIQDPDTRGGQAERVSIGNVWFNEFTLIDFEMGSPIENEYPFGFTPSSVNIIDEVAR